MGASFGALGAEIGFATRGVNNLEQEVRALKLRAWTERDLLSSQVEQAKCTIVCRNFPEWSTSQDREVAIKHALTEAGLHIEGGPQHGELTTQSLVGDACQRSPSSQCPAPHSDKRRYRRAAGSGRGPAVGAKT